jgi:hypothetical protein
MSIADIVDGPVYFLGDALPDLVIEVSYSTGGYVDWTQASEVRLEIMKFGGSKNFIEIVGVTTNVSPKKGEIKFAFSGNPFTTPGKYVAQAKGLFGSKPQRTQRFMIDVEESVTTA